MAVLSWWSDLSGEGKKTERTRTGIIVCKGPGVLTDGIFTPRPQTPNI